MSQVEEEGVDRQGRGDGKHVAARTNEGRWGQMATEVAAAAGHGAGASHLLHHP